MTRPSIARPLLSMVALPALVLIAEPMRANVHAQAPGAVTDSVTRHIMQRLSALSADSMEGRRAGSVGSARARAWIVGELENMGVPPAGESYTTRVTLSPRGGSTDTIGANIVAKISGTRGSGPILVLSAHYDHLGIRNGEVFNGADDDASGCVALLTIAERLIKNRPLHDVVIAFFDAEESGMVGSRAFVADPPIPLERIGLNINLDMVARQDGGALWVSGTSHYPGLKPLALKVAESASIPVRFGHDTRDLKPGDDWTNSSDHAAFHAKGIPFYYLGVEDHPDYHKAGDEADKIDPVFYRGTTEFAAALVAAADSSLEELSKLRVAK